MYPRSPTANAIRYDDMTGDVSNLTVFVPSPFAVSLSAGMFDSAVMLSSTMSVTSNLALYIGSSQHGNATRARVLCNRHCSQ